MSFEITIKEKRDVKKLVGKDWVVLGSKEVPREPRYYDNDEKEPKTRVEAVHGYSPEIEKIVTVDIEVLKQVVDELDLSAVIRAINKL